MRPSANSPWFTITINGSNDFAVYAFSGEEAVSKPYAVRVELVHGSSKQDIQELLGKEACLTFADRSGQSRTIHGLIAHMEQLHRANTHTHYACTIVPRFWFLQETCNHRIFQEQSVPDIITTILEEQGFTGDDFAIKCFGQYEPREYCVQYGESDFHFINRLCEEEGLFYYFEHTDDGHCLCFCDMPGGPVIPGDPKVRFYPGSGHIASEPVIARLQYCGQVKSYSASHREWNFEKPLLDLGVGVSESDKHKAPSPSGMGLETYQYPHIYTLREQGERYVDIQFKRQLCHNRWIECQGDICRFIPSYTFTLTQHKRYELNTEWFVLSVHHEGLQASVLEDEAPDDKALTYTSTITAIPSDVRYVPPIRYPKTPILNKQTAIVTGPEGEEIYPDKYGRVKVQFFWDRLDQWNENTTCWIRVSQGWAGNLYGSMLIPRIGHEVIVSFLEGNPDRPIITGRVYHAKNMPVYELPEHKTRTVFKSMSTPGEPEGERGFHEFRIEDKTGEEEIYIHAEKDLNTYVKNDQKLRVLHDKHMTTEHFTYTRTEKETHAKLEKQRKTVLHRNENLTVHGNSDWAVEGKYLGEAANEIHLESGIKLVLAAGSELTLKVQDNWIKLDGAGVLMSASSINENSGGAPGVGRPAAPLLPEEATVIDPPPPPVNPDCLKSAANKGSVFCMAEE